MNRNRKQNVRVVACFAALGGAVVVAGWPSSSATAVAPHAAETCSVWSVPTLESGPVPVAGPAEGVPYVLVCVGTDGAEVARTVVFGAPTTGTE